METVYNFFVLLWFRNSGGEGISNIIEKIKRKKENPSQQNSRKKKKRETVQSQNVYWRGEANNDNTFSAPSLYFFNFLVLVFSLSSARDALDGRLEASGVVGPVIESFRD